MVVIDWFDEPPRTFRNDCMFAKCPVAFAYSVVAESVRMRFQSALKRALNVIGEFVSAVYVGIGSVKKMEMLLEGLIASTASTPVYHTATPSIVTSRRRLLW